MAANTVGFIKHLAYPDVSWKPTTPDSNWWKDSIGRASRISLNRSMKWRVRDHSIKKNNAAATGTARLSSIGEGSPSTIAVRAASATPIQPTKRQAGRERRRMREIPQQFCIDIGKRMASSDSKDRGCGITRARVKIAAAISLELPRNKAASSVPTTYQKLHSRGISRSLFRMFPQTSQRPEFSDPAFSTKP